MKHVLSLDGGGARLPILLSAIDKLEKSTGKRAYELFDFIIGTSTGSIAAVMLGMGTLSAEELLREVHSVLPAVFKRNSSRKHKYTKEALKGAFERLFPHAVLASVKTKVIVTSWEDTEGKMHFFKSWEAKDGRMPIFDPVDRSSAAPLYFGPVVDKDTAKVWLDGGIGIYNNPVLYAQEQVRRFGWNEKDVQCISIGTGHKDITRTFRDASNDGKLAQILNFLAPKEGGIAREMASSEICRTLECRDWDFHRLDREISKKLAIMDGVKYYEDYCKIGRSIGEELCEVYGNYIKVV